MCYRPTGFVAGTKHVTLADLSLLTTYTTLKASGMMDLTPYDQLPAWLERVKAAVPNYQKADGEGAEKFGVFYKERAAEAK